MVQQLERSLAAVHRRFELGAAAGFAGWCVWGLGLGVGAWGEQAPFPLLDWLTLLGPLCVVPLGLRLARSELAEREAQAWLRLSWLQPLGAACLAAAFALPRGGAATALAVVWVFAAWMIARVGAKRLWAGAERGLEERGLDIALLYLFVGAFMNAVSRWGYTAFGLVEPILTLAATHFYFAGFALLVIGAELGRSLRQAGRNGSLERAWRAAMWGALGSLVPIAAGVLAVPLLELVGALTLAASGFSLGCLLVFAGAPRVRPLWSAALLANAGIALMVASALAGAYAVASYKETGWPTQPIMIWVHGPLHAIVFALGGLLGWVLRARTKGSP